MNERISNKEQGQQTPEQLKESREHQERLREDAERRAERSKEQPGQSLETARDRALEQAEKGPKPESRPDTAPRSAEHEPPHSKKSRKRQFDRTMDEARSHMNPSSRSFSKVIHNPVVEKVSDVAGATVARPNAVLAGSSMAFVAVLVVYLVARHYGYPLSGSESIIAFAGGWVLGILFDYLRVMITGRHV